MDTNDAEMRMYARDMMRQAQPQGQFAASEAGALSLSDIGYDAQGNMIILGAQQAPVYNADTRLQMPPQPTQEVRPEDDPSLSNIERRRAAMARQLQGLE